MWKDVLEIRQGISTNNQKLLLTCFCEAENKPKQLLHRAPRLDKSTIK